VSAPGHAQTAFTLPAGATEVILVRHGSSAHAVPGVSFPIIDGRGDPPLAAEGEEQARAVGRRLAHENVKGLYVTPLQRTAMTAAPLAEASGLEPAVVPELAEVRLGDWEGGEWRVRVANDDPIVRRVFAEERWDIVPGGESAESFTARVRAGLEHVVDATGPDAVAVAVVHGGVIGEACRIATDSRPFAFVHADNGSLTRIVIQPGEKWTLLRFNDVSHLSPVPGAVG